MYKERRIIIKKNDKENKRLVEELREKKYQKESESTIKAKIKKRSD